jgi:vancomycin resistance protein YoaR
VTFLFTKIKKGQKKFLIYGALALILAGAITAALELVIMNSPGILPGVYIGRVDMSGIELKQGEKALLLLYQKALDREIVIQGEGKRWSFTPAQLGVEKDMEKTLHTAWETGRRGPLWERWLVRWQTKKNSCRIPLAFLVDEEKLLACLREMAQMIDREPKNAGMFIKNNHQTAIVPGEDGLRVSITESARELKEVLESEEKVWVDLITRVEKPALTDEEVASWEIKGIVASSETFFNPAKEDRSANIKMAAKALDQILVMPQEIFSFNKVVGPRTTEAGYKESLVIENNQFTPGIGGGVCPVSTTLYNAILLANLPVLERHPHSLPITYVPPGLDATVAYNWADLTFINDRQKPVMLHTEYLSGKIKIMIFANPDEFPQVKLSSKIVEYLSPGQEVIKDPTLAPGQTLVVEKGQRGMIVEVYRESFSEGNTISRELISRDKYKPQKAIIRVPVRSHSETSNPLSKPLDPAVPGAKPSA